MSPLITIPALNVLGIERFLNQVCHTVGYRTLAGMVSPIITVSTFLVGTVPGKVTHLIAFLALNFIHIGWFLLLLTPIEMGIQDIRISDDLPDRNWSRGTLVSQDNRLSYVRFRHSHDRSSNQDSEDSRIPWNDDLPHL